MLASGSKQSASGVNRSGTRQDKGPSDVAALKGLAARLSQYVIVTLVCGLAPVLALAAPFAAYVMDARTGQVLYSKNADTRLHPASLTKMVTLYIVFDAIERGEVSLDTIVTVSKNAASKPPSRLGLKAGQKIALRYLIRAAAVKSANDAASAIGDYLSGSEPAFAERMNRTARALGMKNSTFKTANGLTAAGHLSTAHDMTIVGRRLFYDFPQYYNIFSRRTADAGLAQVRNTNRKFLDSYQGADGIKTGYTGPAGFNLTASAERGNKRIIATIFGGTSTPMRNAKMAELLDLGFKLAPGSSRVIRPGPVVMPADVDTVVASVAATQADGQDEGEGDVADAPAASRRVASAAMRSPRPRMRPDGSIGVATAVDAMQDGIDGALAEVGIGAVATASASPFQTADATGAIRPALRPAAPPAAAAAPVAVATAVPTEISLSDAVPTEPVRTASLERSAPEVVTRISTSGGHHWGINLGHYGARAKAERVLMQTMLSESAVLGDGLRKVAERSGGYDANFVGLTQDQADLACRRLQARAVQCFTIGP